jgi:hypothetical protein
VGDSFGTVPLNLSVLNGVQFSDELTLLDPAQPAFTDDAAAPDGLTVAVDGYKVEFLAYPFEEFGTAAQKVDLMTRTLDWFGTP